MNNFSEFCRRSACLDTTRLLGPLPVMPALVALVAGIHVSWARKQDVDGPPCSPIHAMMKYQPCPRTPVSHVLGLHNKPGHDARQLS